MSDQRKAPPPEENDAQEPPKYIVSYSAMMTILLAFFIMLNTIAQEREYGLKGAGLGAFTVSFVSSGLPGFLTGSTKPTSLGQPGGKWRPETDDTADGKTHVKDERLISSDDKDLESLLQQAVNTQKDVALPLAINPEGTLSPANKRQLASLAKTIRQTNSSILIRASMAYDEASDNPWSQAGQWALRVTEYLCEQEKVPHHRVIAVGCILPDELDEAGNRIRAQSSISVVIVPGTTSEDENAGQRTNLLTGKQTIIDKIINSTED